MTHGRRDAGVQEAVDQAHREEWGRVVASTMSLVRDLDLAEDCAEDAFLSALTTWERDGIPSNPGAWLTTTARRRALDILRRRKTLQSRYALIVAPDAYEEPGLMLTDDIPDERLRLIFTCCHPALAQESRLPLTLRMVCGLSTTEIASLFLVPVPTIQARITRAKKKISAANIPYRVPEAPELPDRLSGVLAVIYQIYSAGHTSPDGQEIERVELIERAIELARVLRRLMPDEREVTGLLALMLLNEARRPTRTDAEGNLVLLEDQDRSQWNHALIVEAEALVLGAMRANPGKYVLQAAIAALHATAPTFAETDWLEILGLYDVLLKVWSSPVVALNRIAAVAMVDGPQVALRQLDELAGDARLAGYRYLPATRADLLRRLNRYDEAAEAYRAALELAENKAERRFLEKRLAQMEG